MKTTEQRINNIVGQLNGIKKMLAVKNPDCFSIIIQLKAIKSAMGSLMEKIISEEFDSCLLDKRIASREKISQIFKEVISK